MSVNFKKSYLKNLDFVFYKKNIICNCYAIFKNPLLEQIRLWMRIRSGPYLEAGGPFKCKKEVSRRDLYKTHETLWGTKGWYL